VSVLSEVHPLNPVEWVGSCKLNNSLLYAKLECTPMETTTASRPDPVIQFSIFTPNRLGRLSFFGHPKAAPPDPPCSEVCPVARPGGAGSVSMFCKVHRMI